MQYTCTSETNELLVMLQTMFSQVASLNRQILHCTLTHCIFISFIYGYKHFLFWLH